MAVAVIPDTGCIVSCSNERVVYWDPVSKEVLGTFTQPQEFCCLHVLCVNSRHSWATVAIAALVYGFAVVGARARCSV